MLEEEKRYVQANEHHLEQMLEKEKTYVQTNNNNKNTLNKNNSKQNKFIHG